MKNQPDIYGLDPTKPNVFFVGPTYCGTGCSVLKRPDSPQILFLLVVFPHRPVEGDPCLFICSEAVEGRPNHVLGIYEESGHKILDNEDGDWTDFDTFKRRAAEIAGERLQAHFVERPPDRWNLKTVSDPSDETFRALTEEGWEMACPKDTLDGKAWFLFRKPKLATPVAV